MPALIPHYSGKFESFRDSDGKQYARLEMTNGSYVWFVFDFFTESYTSLDNELQQPSSDLKISLEQSYRNQNLQVTI